MRLARTTRPQRDNVFPPLNIFRPRQLHDQRLVERRDRCKVEAVQALGCREPRGLDPAFDHAPLTLDKFEFRQPFEITNMFDVLSRALTRQLGVLRQEGGQFKRFEMMIEKQLRDIAHATSSSRLI
jgi:hypothetical protein